MKRLDELYPLLPRPPEGQDWALICIRCGAVVHTPDGRIDDTECVAECPWQEDVRVREVRA